MMRLLIALILLSAAPVSAEELADGRSGLPVPRFVSIKPSKAYLRTGPGDQYPIAWEYVRAGLPVEVISILVNYCIQRQRSRGITRMPSLRSIEKEAYYWADHGIDTMEQAAVYMQNQLLRQSQLGKIRELFGITGRRLTTGEENYILTWLSWGFGEQEIGLAYEKTCMATGGLKWPYCNSILRSWHEQGFTTLSQIESGDRAPQRSYAGAKLSQGVQQHNDTLSDFQLAAIDRMLNNKED